MMIKKNKAYKYRIYPNRNQIEYFSKTFGCVRFIYNQMLGERKSVYEKYKDNKEELKKYVYKTYTQYKKENEWLYEVDSLALANSQINLQSAYKNFFNAKGKVGFPKFKKKNKDLDSYTTNNQGGNIFISDDNKFINLPKIKLVKIKYHRNIPNECIIKSCTVSRTKTNKYYVSILVEYYENENNNLQLDLSKAIGLDYSSKEFYVDSQNVKGNYPKYYRVALDKLKRESRKLSHCELKSKNWLKQKYKVAKLHEKVSNQRKDFLEKLSNIISKQYDIVCIESLNMRAMSQTLNLGKSTMDNSWGMFVNMLERKIKKLVKVDKWFPSSKTCNNCGCVNKDLTLGMRKWECPHCHSMIERDLNASKNILQEGLRLLQI